MKNLHKGHYLILGGWFLINLLQSIFTGLHSDESYYWMYSQNLAWGYFDHPPMIAFLIRAGYSLLSGEPGVRLALILLSTVTLAMILNELNEQKDLFFLAVFVFSFPLVHTHIAGFLALPDIPLLFFTVLFLILYRRFLRQPGLKLSILMAVVASAMIYSKYHAFLILGFTVLSNLKLLRQKYFWIIVALTLLLLTPHIWWQIDNGFPTFRYHLVERAKPFRMKYVLPYLRDQLIIAGPLTGVIIYWKLTKFRIRDSFDKALIFNILGFLIIFLLMSFKNRIEAHWTAAVSPMLMIAVYPLISSHQKTQMWFKRLALPVITIMLLFRIYLAMDVIPDVGRVKRTFYNREEHAKEIKDMAGGRKTGFFNNYAALSNYIFYSGDSAVQLSTPNYRYTQYDLWNEEEYARGDELFAIQSKDLDPPNLTKMVTGQMKGYIIIEEFQPLEGLKINFVSAENTGLKMNFEFVLVNNSGYTIYTEHISSPALAVKQYRNEIDFIPLTCSSKRYKIEPQDTALISIAIPEYRVDREVPLDFYTRSKNMVRGELISYDYDQLFQKR